MTTQLRILHVSDLHISGEIIRDQRVVLKALFKDISETVTREGPFNLVFFTGDLIAQGQYSQDNVKLAVTEFVEPLIRAAAIKKEHFFIVPGNHDINLKHQSKILAAALRQLDDSDSVTSYLNEATGNASPASGLEGFNSLKNEIGHSTAKFSNTLYSAYVLQIGQIKVGVCAINSAWRATGAKSDGDYGHLIVGRKQMDELVNSLEDAEVKFALIHHPLSWLKQRDGQEVHRQLLIHFDALFHGHNHYPEAQVLTGAANSYFVSNAGCLYQSREYFNGYCTIDYSISDNAYAVNAREYVESRQVFDVSTRFAANGRAEFKRLTTIDTEAPRLPSVEYIEAMTQGVNSRLLSCIVSDVAPKTIQGLFVSPRISIVSQRQIDSGNNGTNIIFIPLREIIDTAQNILFLGAKDMGKTTLLHHICTLSIDYSIAGFPSFASYIDLGSCGDTEAAMLESLVAFGKGAYRRSEIVKLLNAGNFAICFDNVQTGNNKQIQSLRSFVANYPKCRYFFTLIEEVEYSLSAAQLPKLPLEPQVYFLHSFSRKETRLLAEKWFGDDISAASSKVDEILKLMARLNVPRSPFIISALLWIREKQSQFAPVNQAEIIDALVDGVMEKLSESKDRSGLDSTNKRHFLGALAEKLHEDRTKSISGHALDAFAVDYFSMKKLPISIGPFLQELKRRGILIEIGSEVAFMFDCIRAFFLSTRMQESPKLFEYAMTSSGFLNLGEELDYYTGRARDKPDVLRRALKLVEEFKIEANLGISLDLFDHITIRESPINSTNAGHMKNNILDSQPTAEQRENILESADIQTHSRDELLPTATRDLKLDSAISRYWESLRIASCILRNSELIDDGDLKSSGYRALSECWCELLVAVLVSVESDDDKSVLSAIRGFLPIDNPALATYFLKMMAPNVIISLALESIGTPKMQLIMEVENESKDFAVKRLLNTFLYIDLDLPKRFEVMADMLKDFGKNRFVSELLFFKTIELFLFRRLQKPEEAKVRKLLGDAMSLMLSIDSKQHSDVQKQRLVAALEKARLAKR
jgi:predicted MPP superfamily phosphohydrolase